MTEKKFTLNILQENKDKRPLLVISGVILIFCLLAVCLYVVGAKSKPELPKIMPLQKPLDLNNYLIVSPTIYVYEKPEGVENSKSADLFSKKVSTSKARSQTPTEAPIPQPSVSESSKTSYYDISGWTEGELRSELNTKGVTSDDYLGEVFDAKTIWHISWRYPKKIRV